MNHRHPLRNLLHLATHSVPGIPAHAEQPPGHQGTTHRAQGRPNPPANHRQHRQPRVLIGLQTRIAALFGQDLH
ncbi:hypothetical protein [Kribbella speibonae]|uniref:Secreted protein n=1 Tax=Kribbella speibonae TaxID=1572660 RepID=A0ABY2ACN5_9ACTN|nr:hypothetical protein [Kribbella speibonae]TCC27453.1 hypothetical protein E0H58_05670 [Kribbella speibonae]